MEYPYNQASLKHWLRGILSSDFSSLAIRIVKTPLGSLYIGHGINLIFGQGA